MDDPPRGFQTLSADTVTALLEGCLLQVIIRAIVGRFCGVFLELRPGSLESLFLTLGA